MDTTAIGNEQPDATALSAARAGDEAAYTSLVEPYRPEVHAHCYRMLGSVHDADDAVQDTLLRAWKAIDRFEARSSLRSWLYRIATNVCLDAIGRRAKRALPVDLRPSAERAVAEERPLTDFPWLEPYPDQELAPGHAAPDARYELRESVELAFVAALQHLPGNQRAALLLFDVLGFSVREIADTMATTQASVNSALQRARKILQERVPEPSQQRTLRALGDEKIRKLVADYSTALENGDLDTLLKLLTEDASWSMPPLADWYAGHQAVANFLVEKPLRVRWQHLPATANGQVAVGCYWWNEEHQDFRAGVLDILTLRGDRIAAVTAFIDGELFEQFGLPKIYQPA
ncbi:sigma-70 family RNA polymerase sigma factor [Flindersiella endophytica]